MRPLVIAICGKQGTGKTTLARSILKGNQQTIYTEEKIVELNANGKVVEAGPPEDFRQAYDWQDITFARQMKAMVSLKRQTQGQMAHDRVLYEINKIIMDLYPSPLAGGPPYNDLIQLIYEIAEYPMEGGRKPRKFLQEIAGDKVKQFDKDVYAKWTTREIRRMIRAHKPTMPDDPSFLPLGVVIEDLRFPNEAAHLHRLHGVDLVIVKLETDPETRRHRVLERDHDFTGAEHNSEKSVDQIPAEHIHGTIDTTYTTPGQALELLKQIVNNEIGSKINA